MRNLRFILVLALITLILTACGSFDTVKEKIDEATETTKELLKENEDHNQNDSNTEGDEEEGDKQEPTNTQEDEQVAVDAERFEVPLLYVIDGDTIKVEINGQEESVRFLLVDTPETSHPQLGKQPFGEEAKAYTERLLSGKTVLLEKDVSERDKYGRLLMYVYTPDGKSVQEELLRNGLARVAYVYAPNTKYVDKYYDIQKEAQANAIGIWSVENYVQEDGYHPDSYKNEKPTQTLINPTSVAFEPDANGGCSGYIKGNHSSNGDWIYHVPEGSYYEVTKAEMCFRTEKAAVEAGYRESQR